MIPLTINFKGKMSCKDIRCTRTPNNELIKLAKYDPNIHMTVNNNINEYANNGPNQIFALSKRIFNKHS